MDGARRDMHGPADRTARRRRISWDRGGIGGLLGVENARRDAVQLHWYKSEDYPGRQSAMTAPDARRALGAFLRAHRERLAPPARRGRPTPHARYAPGRDRRRLRRQPDLDHLARTGTRGLRLAATAGAPGGRAAPRPGRTRLSLRTRRQARPCRRRRSSGEPLAGGGSRLPGRMAIPAYLLDGQWTARAWNEAAAALFVGWLDGENDRNLLRYIFRSRGGADAHLRLERSRAARRRRISRRLQPHACAIPLCAPWWTNSARRRRPSPACGANRRCSAARAANAASARRRAGSIRRRLSSPPTQRRSSSVSRRSKPRTGEPFARASPRRHPNASALTNRGTLRRRPPNKLCRLTKSPHTTPRGRATRKESPRFIDIDRISTISGSVKGVINALTPRRLHRLAKA